MILSGHQPNYWPYPGLIGKIMLSDCFVYVTKVQFEKKSWQKRNRIRTKEGWNYIQVPTITKGKFDQNICDVEIDNNNDWREKTLKTIQLLYGKAPFYKEYSDFITDFYSKDWKMLSDMDIEIMNFILNDLGCDTKIYYDKDYNFEGNKTAMLVDMCKKIGCDTYLSNLGSSAYVQIDEFTQAGLNHQYIDYTGVEYRQQFGGFEPGLSILDMLMNCGREKTREIVLNRANYEFSELNKDLHVE
ncbi:MAG: WbqC family protein [Lachnospiraceae bacterium]|nr:WbqC family protein [Lachnospiraceae bacterium]